MMQKRGKYRIELAAENLLKALTRLINSFRKFFFVVPKKKMDKYIFVMETAMWLMLTITLILRWGKF